MVQSDSDVVAFVLFDTYKEIYSKCTFDEVQIITEKLMHNIDGDLDEDSIKSIARLAKPYLKKIHEIRESDTRNERANERASERANEREQHRKREEVPNAPVIEPTLSYKDAYVLIDSMYRDTSEFATHNPFSIHFGDAPSRRTLLGVETRKPSVNRKFTDVHSISIRRVIVPLTSDHTPYMTLSIPELGQHLFGNNDTIASSFCYLANGKTTGDYIIYEFGVKDDSHAKRIFNPRIEISKLSFVFKNQHGDIIGFDDNDKSIVIELAIETLHKEFENFNLHVPNS